MPNAYLEINLEIENEDRASAAAVYEKYKGPFLETIEGAKTKKLLVRDEDVQVIHGFDTAENASAYLNSDLFTEDVTEGLKPFLKAAPDVRIYTVV